MGVDIANICLDCADAYALGRFWSAVLDLPLADDDEPGDEEVGIALPTGQDLLFLQVPEPKTVKNRMHLCLTGEGPGQRDAEVERVLALGATVVDDRRTPDGRGWVVLADPEGNEFCVVRNEADMAADAD